MKRVQILLTKKQEEFLGKHFRSTSSGLREALTNYEENLQLENHLKEFQLLHQRIEKLLVKLEEKTNAMVLEDYVTYLHTYAKNRSFILPTRFEFFEQGGQKLLREEQELSHSMRIDEAYRYTERREAELRYGLNLSDYHHFFEEKTNHPYSLDLVLYSYDYRSVFLFLTDIVSGEKKKLRTLKKHFIDTLRFIKPRSAITLSAVKNERGYLEIVGLEEKEKNHE